MLYVNACRGRGVVTHSRELLVVLPKDEPQVITR
jgi:hypothetical protein